MRKAYYFFWGGLIMSEVTSVEKLKENASELMQKEGFRFADFCSLFLDFRHEQANLLFNNILNDILEQAELNGKPAYSEQTHLATEGDFHLSLKLVGEGDETQEQSICVSDFDMILVSLADQPFSLPVYRTGINPVSPDKRPASLPLPYRMDIEPYRPYLFEAFSDIADLDFANTEASTLVVHSKPRAPVPGSLTENT